ncbi:MAG TPA: phosphoenolpyruvate carboxykinase (ATP), partial [Geminicoccaceae bacterium]|nr:phosphoenolpyruvate carboxykinase (ATP) [Geminicoccaceae bacterium]
MEQIGPAISRFGLDHHGLSGLATAYWNLPTALLVEHAVRRGEGDLAEGGPFVARTGKYTGRSPDDKFIVDRPSIRDAVNWGEVNRPIGPESFDRLLELVKGHMKGREVFVQDLHAGADPDYRLPVRVVTTHAWHALFARNMFITPPESELAGFEPGFTVLHAPDLQADPDGHGTNSEAFIVVDFDARTVLVGGTSYAGEIKKSIFGVLNHLLPDR